MASVIIGTPVGHIESKGETYQAVFKGHVQAVMPMETTLAAWRAEVVDDLMFKAAQTFVHFDTETLD